MKALALLVALTAMAGCADPEPAAAPEPVVPTPTDAVEPEPIDAADERPTAPRTFRLGENLTYDHQVRRYVLVADGNATVSLDVEATPASVDRPANCLAFAADLRVPDAAAPVAGIYFVAWAGDASIYGEVTVLGQGFELLGDPFGDQTGLAGLQVDGEVDLTMLAGDRLTIQIGGATVQPEAELKADLLVVGDAHLEELPPAPLACGRGLRDAKGSDIGLATYLVTSSVGGELAFVSAEASTMLAARIGLSPESQVRYEFPGVEAAPFIEDLFLTSADTGRMALLIDRDVDEAGGTAWFFADTEWPIEAEADEGA